MPRQYYSDKYIRHIQDAQKAENRLERGRLLESQAESEEREERRRTRQEAIADAHHLRMSRFDIDRLKGEADETHRRL